MKRATEKTTAIVILLLHYGGSITLAILALLKIVDLGLIGISIGLLAFGTVIVNALATELWADKPMGHIFS